MLTTYDTGILTAPLIFEKLRHRRKNIANKCLRLGPGLFYNPALKTPQLTN